MTEIDLCEEGEKKIFKNTINPDHYKLGGLETINILESKLTREAFLGFLTGNIMKYMIRAKMKGGIEDYEKAQWYLTYMLNKLKKEETHHEK